MARNEEKAQSMLSRYLQTKKQGRGRNERRPYLAILCDDVDEAEKWRLQIIGDIRRRVAEIQNPGLEDTRVRELNDAINKLLRERKHWEGRIVYLGGKDHARHRKGHSFSDGKDGAFEHQGYFYFGVARNLPGVQELIERQDRLRMEKKYASREENSGKLHRRVDIEYYGYLDDHDGSLEQEEKEAEEERRKYLVGKWEEKHDTGVDEPWDCSYLQYIGKKPSRNPDLDVQALILERKKREALEQLEGGVNKASE